MRALKTYLSLIMLFFLRGSYGQDVDVLATLDTNAMLIGDHVGLTLKFTGPANTQVQWPLIPDTILGSISVIGRGAVDTTYSADKKSVTYAQELNLTCFDSGFYTIPQIPFRYSVLPDTSRLLSATTMLLLAVHTVQVDTTQAIKPIIGPLKVPLSFREMLPWILGALAVAAIIMFVIWYYRKRKRKEPVFSLKPAIILPPHETALRELENLRVKKLWQAGRVKEYHSELTEILRKYIEDRFKVPALEQTSTEIINSLSDRAICQPPSLDKLGSLLILADMVKFAKAQPMALENEKCLSEGIEFVKETTTIGNA